MLGPQEDSPRTGQPDQQQEAAHPGVAFGQPFQKLERQDPAWRGLLGRYGRQAQAWKKTAAGLGKRLFRGRSSGDRSPNRLQVRVRARIARVGLRSGQVHPGGRIPPFDGHFQMGRTEEFPARILAEPGEVHHGHGGRDHGEAEQGPDCQTDAIVGRGPAARPPSQQRNQQQPALGPRVDGKRHCKTGSHEVPDAQFAHRPPDVIEGKHEQKPECRVADDQRRNGDQFPVQRIHQAGRHGQAIVEHSPQPTPQRHHRERGHEHAEILSGDLPVDSQMSKRNQEERIDIQTELGEALLIIALFQANAGKLIMQAIAPENIPVPGRHRPRDQARHQQQYDDPRPSRQVRTRGRTTGEIASWAR